MSLWVYLYAAQPVTPGSGIFVRENGAINELSRDEWNAKFPGKEPIIVDPEPSNEVFSRNITHNLGKMASEAGVYDAIWRPDEPVFVTAWQLIEPLRAGLALLQSEPDRFKELNPANGWGDYDGLVSFVAAYLSACEEYPDARVEVSR